MQFLTAQQNLVKAAENDSLLLRPEQIAVEFKHVDVGAFKQCLEEGVLLLLDYVVQRCLLPLVLDVQVEQRPSVFQVDVYAGGYRPRLPFSKRQMNRRCLETVYVVDVDS